LRGRNKEPLTIRRFDFNEPEDQVAPPITSIFSSLKGIDKPTANRRRAVIKTAMTEETAGGEAKPKEAMSERACILRRLRQTAHS
jgi:hypothetical protein